MQKIHFVAIGGQGMSGIARILLEKGYFISGSDLKAGSTTERLEKLGARIYLGHRAENVVDPDVVVVSSAISEDNPEVLEARSRGIPVVHRMDMLLEVVKGKKLVAVAGAHGKTTTASMIAWILEKDGKDPTYLVGGEFTDEGNARLGKGEEAVFETDESDGSFLKAHPDVSVVTNIDNDHLDYWGSMDALEEAFYRFLDGTREGGRRVVCVDDPRLLKWAQSHPDAVTYSLHQDSVWQARNIEKAGWGTVSDIFFKGRRVCRLRLRVPGEHNVQDALGAIAAAHARGVDVENACEHLSSFTGAKRRLEYVGTFGGIMVFDDFAHHPSEIRASIRAIKESLPSRRIIVIFQPHRYSRTRILQKQFGSAFQDADALIVTSIYAGPGEAPEPRVSSSFISDSVRAFGRPPVQYVPDMVEAARRAAALSGAGDVIVTMGAGDIWKALGPLENFLARTVE
ncbi:MAG: UDP-N-acetylmuramate--L-alanine ligase [Candidatus Fermentithermobacillus carboniphilus]|uniref:UDP-N-acetylmuramate--L-alanine ligase n=1 Tax=Candidatus Fermentithermobacillus carboniphilus TaxID=3085328 RepID=A0AAT9LDB1_9FIRM|nr:MAG: UDP-N-acetylmuramate--L-alanine ligase [Candidatus Fermentithermobacillus carboniphilus]